MRVKRQKCFASSLSLINKGDIELARRTGIIRTDKQAVQLLKQKYGIWTGKI